MANITYYVDGCTAQNWNLGRDPQTGQLACVNSPVTNPGTKFAFTYNDSSESRTKASGDRVHALPFTGTYMEVTPMSGKVDVQHRFYQLNTSASLTYCKEKAGMTQSFSADIGYYVRGSASAPPPPSNPALMLALKKQADTKALADLRRSFYNLPLIIGERKETVDMLRRKGLQIAAVVKARQTVDLQRWLKTRRADKRRVARDIAGEHLAVLFGFLPLISEIEGICAALASDVPTKITGRGRASDTKETMVNTTNGVPQYSNVVFPSALFGIKETKTVRYSHRTSVSCTVTISGAQYARDAGINPLATFYDLVPLSFLSEFVSNLGTFIRALDPLIGVDFLTGSSTSWVENRTTWLARGYSRTFRTSDVYWNTNTTQGEGTASARYLQVKRSVLTDYPDPSLMFVNNLTLAKVGTLASLAIQRYLKPVRRLFAIKTFRYKGPRPKYLPPINYR